MSRAGLPGRSSSVRNPPGRSDFTTSPLYTLEQEACYDTALPPMSSKQLVLASRRPGLDTSAFSNRIGFSQHSMAVSGGSSGHRRTGSTLKTVMRKFFTRKRRSQTDGFDGPMHDFRFSDDTPLPNKNGAKSPTPSKSTSSHRSNVCQQNQEDLTTLDDVLKQLDSKPRQRRATLPSLIFSDDESRHALEALVHSDKPPGNRTLSPHASSDPDELRRGEMRNIKRRSRSAAALRTMARDHRMSPIQWRPRSVESEHMTSTTYGIASDSESRSSRPPTRTTVASTSKPSVEQSVFEEEETEEEEEDVDSIPPNVGELISSMQNDDNATVEQRLTTLEVKLIDLEFAIARMQSGRGETPANAPSHKHSIPDLSRHQRKKSSSYSPPSGSDCSAPAELVAVTERPVSTSTIRPTLSEIHRARALQTPSSASLSDTGAISVQQYSALVMLLRREQTARRNLEQQVSSLRDDVDRLYHMARDSIGVGTMYPIRSMDSHEYLRVRHDTLDSRGSSPMRTDEKLSSRYESDSDFERSEIRPKDDGFRPWQSTRRIEVAKMI